MEPSDFGSGDGGRTVTGRYRARENGLIQRLRRSFADLGEPRPALVLVGYSGGADSLALLGLLIALGRHDGFAVRAVHVDHGVRPESAADAAVVRAVCLTFGVELDVRVVQPDALARHAGVGREEAMRRERYREFVGSALACGADLVALGHHQRDQAETVLLHVLRGSGIRGASGMRLRSTMAVPWWADASSSEPVRQLRVLRPLLGESAQELRSAAELLGVPIVEDVSNADRSYRRNAIRHDALPALERVISGSTATLARFAGLAADDSDELDRQAWSALASVGSAVQLDRRWLVGLPLAIRRRVVQFWIAANASASLEISLDRIEEVLRIAGEKGRPRVIEIGEGVAVRIERNALVFVQGQSSRPGVLGAGVK